MRLLQTELSILDTEAELAKGAVATGIALAAARSWTKLLKAFLNNLIIDLVG